MKKQFPTAPDPGEPEDNGELELRVGRVSATLRGRHLMMINILILVLILLSGFHSYLLARHADNVQINDAGLVSNVNAALGPLITEQKKTTQEVTRAADATNRASWISLQPEAEKARLRGKLSMPPSLREELR